jgi:hypothetical protein
MNAAEIAFHRKMARRHATTRCRERHNIDLRPRDLASLETRIREGDGEIIRVLPDGRRTIRIRFLFDLLMVSFDPELDCIVTVLPRHCREWRSRPSERQGES